MAGHALSPAARADIEEIRDRTVRHWGEAQAERYTRTIRDACEALGDGTLSGRSAEDIRAGYRKAAVGSHVLFHRVRADVVEIVRILHRSMDVGRHIQPRFADEREVALGRLALPEALRAAETMRAEEVVLSVPDGRSLATLLDVTPIRSGDVAVASVVVTLQDLAPPGRERPHAGAVRRHGGPRAAHSARRHQGLERERCRIHTAQFVSISGRFRSSSAGQHGACEHRGLQQVRGR